VNPAQHPAILGGSIGQGTSVSPASSQIVHQFSSNFNGLEHFAAVQRTAGGLLAASPLLSPAIGAPFTFRNPEED
jgi:hypothetical protein